MASRPPACSALIRAPTPPRPCARARAPTPPHLSPPSPPRHTSAVLFGLLILLSAAVAAACFRMRRGVLATSLVALLWLLNAVIMLLGLGERAAQGWQGWAGPAEPQPWRVSRHGRGGGRTRRDHRNGRPASRLLLTRHPPCAVVDPATGRRSVTRCCARCCARCCRPAQRRQVGGQRCLPVLGGLCVAPGGAEAGGGHPRNGGPACRTSCAIDSGLRDALDAGTLPACRAPRPPHPTTHPQHAHKVRRGPNVQSHTHTHTHLLPPSSAAWHATRCAPRRCPTPWTTTLAESTWWMRAAPRCSQTAPSSATRR